MASSTPSSSNGMPSDLTVEANGVKCFFGDENHTAQEMAYGTPSCSKSMPSDLTEVKEEKSLVLTRKRATSPVLQVGDDNHSPQNTASSTPSCSNSMPSDLTEVKEEKSLVHKRKRTISPELQVGDDNHTPQDTASSTPSCSNSMPSDLTDVKEEKSLLHKRKRAFIHKGVQIVNNAVIYVGDDNHTAQQMAFGTPSCSKSMPSDLPEVNMAKSLVLKRWMTSNNPVLQVVVDNHTPQQMIYSTPSRSKDFQRDLTIQINWIKALVRKRRLTSNNPVPQVVDNPTPSCSKSDVTVNFGAKYLVHKRTLTTNSPVLQVGDNKHTPQQIASTSSTPSCSKSMPGDLTVVVNGTKYLVNKSMMVMNSPVLQAMLSESMWKEYGTNNLVLHEWEQCAHVFPLFVNYINKVEITLDMENVIPLLLLSDKYLMKNLQMFCARFMSENLAVALTQKKLLTWCQETQDIHDETHSDCLKFLMWNIELVVKMDDLSKLNTDIMVRILASSLVAVKSEIVLYRIAVKWIKSKLEQYPEMGPDETFNLIKEIMENIRFPLMFQEELQEVGRDLPNTERINAFFDECKAIAQAFHSNQAEKIAQVSRTKGDQIFTPRRYTYPIWSLQVQVNNFNNKESHNVRTYFMRTFEDEEGRRYFRWFMDIDGFYCCTPTDDTTPTRKMICSINASGPAQDAIARVNVLVYTKDCGVEHVTAIFESTDLHRFGWDNSSLAVHKCLPLEKAHELAGKSSFKLLVLITPVTYANCVDDFGDINLVRL